MVMERMHGTPVSQVERLRERGVDIPRLARAGVEIFFTQVFRDGFFHADMHPGNIFVSDDGKYVALDFGIMGTLSETDKNYLAQNFLAFFNRDYRRVAQAHLDAGWVPEGTRIDDFEGAIRAVCEPIFARPLKEIYFGKLLLRLFQTSRRFNVEIQPQLVLLQKTLLNIEGLGRTLDPELDLWQTAKPFLERWMSEQIGWRGFARALRQEAPTWAATLPQLPRLAHRLLAEDRLGALERALARDHFVQHGAKREQVGARVHGLSAHLLGRHVPDRAHHGARVGHGRHRFGGAGVRPRRRPRQTEVENLHLSVGEQEQVLGLQIAVEQGLVVGGAETTRDLDGDLGRLANGQGARLEALAQRLALEQLHDREDESFVHADIVNRQDVGMRQGGHGLGLALEPRTALRISGDARGQYFDRDVAIEPAVAGAIDLAHASRADGGHDFIGAKAST